MVLFSPYFSVFELCKGILWYELPGSKITPKGVRERVAGLQKRQKMTYTRVPSSWLAGEFSVGG